MPLRDKLEWLACRLLFTPVVIVFVDFAAAWRHAASDVTFSLLRPWPRRPDWVSVFWQSARKRRAVVKWELCIGYWHVWALGGSSKMQTQPFPRAWASICDLTVAVIEKWGTSEIKLSKTAIPTRPINCFSNKKTSNKTHLDRNYGPSDASRSVIRAYL